MYRPGRGKLGRRLDALAQAADVECRAEFGGLSARDDDTITAKRVPAFKRDGDAVGARREPFEPICATAPRDTVLTSEPVPIARVDTVAPGKPRPARFRHASFDGRKLARWVRPAPTAQTPRRAPHRQPGARQGGPAARNLMTKISRARERERRGLSTFYGGLKRPPAKGTSKCRRLSPSCPCRSTATSPTSTMAWPKSSTGNSPPGTSKSPPENRPP